MSGRCIHCGARVAPPVEVCESCVDLLSDLGEEDEPQPMPPPPPRPAPRPRPRTGRYEPTAREIAEYEELSERGSFRPLPKQLPHHVTNRWGKAIASLKRSRRDPDVPRQ